MSTGRERVLTALNFIEPDRVPLDFGSYPGATSINVMAYKNLLDYLGLKKEVEIAHLLMFTAEVHDEVLDIFDIDTKSIKPTVSVGDYRVLEEFEDPNWKVIWKRGSDFTYAPVRGPFQNIEEPKVGDVRRYKWPKPSEIENPEKWREKAKRIRDSSDRALVARTQPGPLTLAAFLRGYEGWALDLYLHPEFSRELHRRITDLWIETTVAVADAVGENVDVFIIGDDFSLQDQAMMPPDLYRQLIKPLLKEMVTELKKHTRAKVGLHACGTVYEFIDDFIDMGFDILNPLQSNAKDMQADKIKKKAAGKIALWGGVDTHDVLPRGTPEDVKKEVKEKIARLGRAGGYVLCADHNILIDVPPQNVVALYEAAAEYGVYR